MKTAAEVGPALAAFAADGVQALMSYVPNFAAQFRRTAYCVDRILKGTKAADLPFEQPSPIEFVVNRKTAKAIGIAIPRSTLLRADRVIEWRSARRDGLPGRAGAPQA